MKGGSIREQLGAEIYVSSYSCSDSCNQRLGINLACKPALNTPSIEKTIIVFVFLSVTLTALVMEDRKITYKYYR